MLIVFLFAAVLAISLYMEMPIVAFEAKRAKEGLLIDRGKEYARAVKLYYRKFRSYPPSLDALESTNNMRFLRHRYKDPMTGDTTWRLLHAGPGGQLTDSKVNPISPTTGNGFSNGSSFASSGGSASSTNTQSGTGFNSSSTASSTDTGNGTVVAALPQRPPEMPINGGSASSMANNVDPSQSLLGGATAQDQTAQPATGTVPAGVAAAVNAQNPAQLAQAAGGASLSTPMQGVQGLFANPNPAATAANPAAAPQSGGFGATTGFGSSSAGPGASTGTGFGPSSTSTPFSAGANTQSNFGRLQSGGIAGVASLAKGSSIKLVNEQKDYSLWEFYYDPTKDTSIGGQSGVNPVPGATTPNGFGLNPTAPNNGPPANSTSSPPAPTPTGTMPSSQSPQQTQQP